MPSPRFTFRLPAQDLASVKEVAKVYGSPSPGAFIAEMVGVICSGDPKRIADFNGRLIQKMGEQLAFQFVQQAAKQAGKQAKTAKKGAKGHGRTTR